MKINPETLVVTDQDLENTISRISFDKSTINFNWKFRHQAIEVMCQKVKREGWLIWAEFERPDINTGKQGTGRGRDEIIWKGTGISGLVKTCYVLVEMLIRHELMEGFRFDGKAPFNPHNTISELMLPYQFRKNQEITDTYAILSKTS